MFLLHWFSDMQYLKEYQSGTANRLPNSSYRDEES